MFVTSMDNFDWMYFHTSSLQRFQNKERFISWYICTHCSKCWLVLNQSAAYNFLHSFATGAVECVSLRSSCGTGTKPFSVKSELGYLKQATSSKRVDANPFQFINPVATLNIQKYYCCWRFCMQVPLKNICHNSYKIQNALFCTYDIVSCLGSCLFTFRVKYPIIFRVHHFLCKAQIKSLLDSRYKY